MAIKYGDKSGFSDVYILPLPTNQNGARLCGSCIFDLKLVIH